MGRKLMRVPLDFSWPTSEVWGGYLNPHYRYCAKCKSCEGTGYGPEAKNFKDQWYGKTRFDAAEYGATPLTVDHPAIVAFAERNVASAPGYYGINKQTVSRESERLWHLWKCCWSHNLIQADVDALAEEGRLMEFTRRPRTPEQAEKLAESGNYWMTESNGYTPTADEVNAWSMSGRGHDSINCWVCIEARCKREGVELKCPACEGSGEIWASHEAKQAAEDWKREDPPTGEGFQLWETTTEGSPQSPVFKTLGALCDWCETNATTFGSAKTSASEWRRMLDADFVVHLEGNAVFL